MAFLNTGADKHNDGWKAASMFIAADLAREVEGLNQMSPKSGCLAATTWHEGRKARFRGLLSQLGRKMEGENVAPLYPIRFAAAESIVLTSH
jgi:hypothetical protein